MAKDSAGGRARTALITDVKKNALDDGPGIRTVVFFKGCPLSCAWCQNPEAVSPRPELQVLSDCCIGCERCVEACPEDTARPALEPQPRADCRICGACVEVCPGGGRRLVGEPYDLDDLIAVLARDEPFYRRSGGGVTFSGGEPTLHMAFAGELAAALAERGIPVLLETCGHFAWAPFEEKLLPHLDAVYFDVKLLQSDAHRRHTGIDNGRILENLRRLAGMASRLEVLPRVPLVPRITDGEENLSTIADLLVELGFGEVALLPYNPLWLPKRRSLGFEPAYTHESWMSQDEVERCAKLFEEAGLRVMPVG